jgi:hypothetical protein
MAVSPVFRSWVAGEIVTASYMNTNIRDAGNFFLAWPVCETRQTVAQSIATGGAGAPLLFDFNDSDTDGGHSTVTNTSRYTGKTAGRFQFSGASSFAANGTGRRACLWYVNNVTGSAGQVAINATATGDAQIPARARTYFLNGSTDYVELWAWHDSGVTLSTLATPVQLQPNMSVRMVGTT